jgi:hypothetical protein
MSILDLSRWGYPANRDNPARYRCRVHGVVVNMVRIEVRNEEYDLVFDRRYCSICYDTFLQRHLDPLVETTSEEVNPYE